MQEKDNITQRINTFLDREEVRKNKYKPRRTSKRPRDQVKEPEANRKPTACVQVGKVQVG